jgi:DNA protecting protein DprA
MEKRIYTDFKCEPQIAEDHVILERINKSGYKFDLIECRGGRNQSRKPFIGVVGARLTTDYGRYVTNLVVRELATAGATIISGLMYGVDLIAHNVALVSGGKTIGVLGYGFEHLGKMSFARKTSQSIVESKDSILISQFEGDYPPSKWTYPNRNMLIAALSDVLIVVEAGLNSGSLITANFALELGKDIYAVPGSIFSEKSKGTNSLIKDGAFLLDNIDDLLNNLKLSKENKLSCVEQHVLTLLREREGKSISYVELLYECNANERELNAALAKLKYLKLIKFDGVIVSSGQDNSK